MLPGANNSSINAERWCHSHQKSIKIVLSVAIIVGAVFTILAGLAFGGQLHGIPPPQYMGSFLGTCYFSLSPVTATFLLLGIMPLMSGGICLIVHLQVMHCPKQHIVD